MESSGQVTKTEEMMINGEGNDASRTCSRWDKRTGEDGSQSVQRRALAREIFGEVHAIWTPSCAEIRSIRADTSFWKIKKFKRR